MNPLCFSFYLKVFRTPPNLYLRNSFYEVWRVFRLRYMLFVLAYLLGCQSKFEVKRPIRAAVEKDSKDESFSVTAPESVTSGEDLVVSWTEVDGAEDYSFVIAVDESCQIQTFSLENITD